MRHLALILTLTLVIPLQVRAEEAAEGKKKPLTYLVPEMEGTAFSVESGTRPYAHRLSFSPAFGRFGSTEYFAFRLGYAPSQWLAYEANLGHNPSTSVHALVNTLHAALRYPLSGRFQPYVSTGFGMVLVFPGAIFKADPVTKNVLSAGVGLEIFLREDVALRGEYRGTRLLGGVDNVDAELTYGEYTVGLSFFRTLRD